ncbi:hypothetical protein NDU88_005284 [Pleurodeles waltl]|uniref:Uncharacterized protein n=1 Tax=Pleurodeles waltl TaxID=8319 RepID=A0AAV7RMV4_PLEWA|nr:hypothetical protein NDU88_005284 [Pleurodeles waltl]
MDLGGVGYTIQYGRCRKYPEISGGRGREPLDAVPCAEQPEQPSGAAARDRGRSEAAENQTEELGLRHHSPPPSGIASLSLPLERGVDLPPLWKEENQNPER